MKKGDVWIGIILIGLLAVFFVPRWLDLGPSQTGNLYAKITVDGELYQMVELTEEAQEIRIESKHGLNILKIFNHGAIMVEADCPDKLCMTFGFVNKVGQSIVCLPHRVLVEIVGEMGESGDGVDAVVQ